MDFSSMLGGAGGGGGGGGGGGSKGKSTSSTAQSVIGSQIRSEQADVAKWLVGGVAVVLVLGLLGLVIWRHKA